jgi:hypothetical protein
MQNITIAQLPVNIAKIVSNNNTAYFAVTMIYCLHSFYNLLLP